MTCRACRRVLSNPESMRLGIGPVCARKKKAKAQKELFDNQIGHVVQGEFSGDIVLSRTPDGRPVANIAQTEVRHSPTGFEWGYSGSGPADLALNILLQFTDRRIAFLLHQNFKVDFLSAMPREGGVIKETVIQEWLKKKKEGIDVRLL